MNKEAFIFGGLAMVLVAVRWLPHEDSTFFLVIIAGVMLFLLIGKNLLEENYRRGSKLLVLLGVIGGLIALQRHVAYTYKDPLFLQITTLTVMIVGLVGVHLLWRRES